MAFFGWCNFTQVLASAGRVIRSCWGMMMHASLVVSTASKKIAKTTDEKFHSCVSSSDAALGLLTCPCGPRTRTETGGGASTSALSGSVPVEGGNGLLLPSLSQTDRVSTEQDLQNTTHSPKHVQRPRRRPSYVQRTISLRTG